METRRLVRMTPQDGHLDSHTAPELWVTDYPVRRPNTQPGPMLGCTFPCLIKLTHIFVTLAFVFKSCNDLKLLESCNTSAIASCEPCPLWVSSRFSRSKNNELWSRRIKSVTVPASLTGYVASTAIAKTKNKNCRHYRNRCPRCASTARNFFWRNYVGDFPWCW